MVIVGIDEVGRGCWAGPLVVGAVILEGPTIDGLADSKALSKVKRAKLAQAINSQALEARLGWAWPSEIDELGLSRSTALATQRALDKISNAYDQVLIDGSFNFLPDNPKCRTQIKADQSVPEVSAASIIAKVARDEYMKKTSVDFPIYGFDKHVGYGTGLHLDMLKKHGPCKLHRFSFKPVNGAV